MNNLVEKIISDSNEEFAKDIVTFQKDYGSKVTFEELDDDTREKLWESLFVHLSDNSQSSIHQQCLSILRILSRDKTNLNNLITEERMDLILDKAGLQNETKQITNFTDVTIEALKLLCNLIFNSTIVQLILPTTSCLSCLIERMKVYESSTAHEVMLFDTRLLFLITATNSSTRHTVNTELRGDRILVNMLENINSQNKSTLKTDTVMLACEILKVLFNLYMHAGDWNDKEEEREKNENLMTALYKLLLCTCKTNEDDLHSNIANLLTAVPEDSYSAIIPTNSYTAKGKGKHVYQDRDMRAISTLLNFLNNRLDSKTDLMMKLSPIVTAFLRMTRNERLIRKYTKLQILPPLKDVMQRPEVGTTLRAKLCKLLTTPLTELRDLVADFLFVLCKENVSRMVKYTGYGNAAGMFANKGLLGPSKKKEVVYSSESDDSDTEEYLKHKEQINPITGCFEKPKQDPMKGMTEEQKEYEALQLVGLVDKLTREGVIKPCRIGEDGKPEAIEHVLELQEQLPKQQYREDSDSD